jgi:hypothetical protein
MKQRRDENSRWNSGVRQDQSESCRRLIDRVTVDYQSVRLRRLSGNIGQAREPWAFIVITRGSSSSEWLRTAEPNLAQDIQFV